MGKISCFFCTKKCRGDVLKVADKYFHKECFTCKVCHQKLEDTAFFCKGDTFYCASDYKQYCASECYFCHRKIIGEVVSALSRTFHKDCFKCSKCQSQFLAGDKVSLRNGEFLCSDCVTVILNSSTEMSSKDLTNHITPSISCHTTSPKLTNNKVDTLEKMESILSSNSHHNVNDNKDYYGDSSTVPIRRKQVQNPTLTLSPTKSSARPPSSISKHRSQILGTTNGNLDEPQTNEMAIMSSISAIPKHFHIPPGSTTGRSWVNSPSIVGSKNHPLALSTSHLSRTSHIHDIDNSQPNSLAGTPRKSAFYNYNDLVDKGKDTRNLNGGIIKRLSSYPAGQEQRGISRIDRDDFPAPPASNVIFTERNRRKIQNPTIEALSAGTTPKIRKAKSSNPNDRISAPNGTLNKMSMVEAIKRSTTDCSNYTRDPHVTINGEDVPQNPISASRCPSASCEPLIPPRYEVHLETSPSRNDEYFRSSDRHLGYSMEFIHSTSRTFLNDNTSVSGSRQNLRHSYDPRMIPNELNGLKRVRVSSQGSGDYRSYTLPAITIVDNGDEVDEGSHQMQYPKSVPYGQLRISTLKRMKHLDRTKLESYLSDEEFQKVFKLNRPSFYRLPEWKRNDLKKKVDLF